MAFKETPSTVIAARNALINSLEEQIVDTGVSIGSEELLKIATAQADWLIGSDYMSPDFMDKYRVEER